MKSLPEAFDEDIQELIEYLLHNFWISRARNPEVFYAIHERQDLLRAFFYEKFKYDFVLQPEVVKVEKVPATPKPWMGIEEFAKKEDYVFFSLVMAFLEKLLFEQFVLSDLTKYISTHYPTGEHIEWTLGRGYHNRLSLIRVLKYIEMMGMIESVEYKIDDFKVREDYEVLYNKTPLHRYYMRNHTMDLAKASTLVGVFSLAWEEAEEKGVGQKERLYRNLLLLPCLHDHNLSDIDIEYMRDHHDYMAHEFENYLGCSFELYKSTAFLLREFSNTESDIFPNRRKETIVITQLASLLRDYIRYGALYPDAKGRLFVTKIQLEAWIEEIKTLHSHEWPIAYLSESITSLTNEVIQHLTELNFIEFDFNRNEFIFYDVIGRICGYSVDKTLHSNIGGENDEFEK